MTEQETDEVSVRTDGFGILVRDIMEGITEEEKCDEVEQKLKRDQDRFKTEKSRKGFPYAIKEVDRRREQLKVNKDNPKVVGVESSIDVEKILDETTLEESRVEEEEKSIRRGLKAQVENTLSHLKLISSEGPWRVVEKLTSPPSVTFFSERGGNYLIFVTLGASEEGSSNTYESEFTLTGSRVSYSHPKCVVYQGKGKDRAGNPYRGKSAIYSNSSTSNGVTLCVTATAIFDVGQTSAESNFVRRLRSENSREYKCVNITSDTYIRINGCFFRVEKNENTSNTKT